MYEFCGNRGKVTNFESITLKGSIEILVDKDRYFFVKWSIGFFPKTLKDVLKQREAEIVGKMHHWLWGNGRP